MLSITKSESNNCSCSLVWGTSSPSLMYELEHIHARAAKIIHRLLRDISDQDALETTGWEPLSNQYKKKLLTLMYKVNSIIIWLCLARTGNYQIH